MAIEITQNWSVTSTHSSLIASFLPSPGSARKHACVIDTLNPKGLGGIVQAKYKMIVELNKSKQALVFDEEVSGSVAGNAVTGTLSIPIRKLEQPQFDMNVYGSSKKKASIKISFALLKGQALNVNEFLCGPEGSWSDSMLKTLQMWMVDEWASDTRIVEIILVAPGSVGKIKIDIERALAPPSSVNSTLPRLAPALQIVRAGGATITPATNPVGQAAVEESPAPKSKTQRGKEARMKRLYDEIHQYDTGHTTVSSSQATTASGYEGSEVSILPKTDELPKKLRVPGNEIQALQHETKGTKKKKANNSDKSEPLHLVPDESTWEMLYSISKSTMEMEIISRLTRENLELRAKVESLSSKIEIAEAALSAEKSVNSTQMKKLQDEINFLQRPAKVATQASCYMHAPSNVSAGFLNLRNEQQERSITPMTGTNTSDHSRPESRFSWLDDSTGLSSDAPASEDSPPQYGLAARALLSLSMGIPFNTSSPRNPATINFGSNDVKESPYHRQ